MDEDSRKAEMRDVAATLAATLENMRSTVRAMTEVMMRMERTAAELLKGMQLDQRVTQLEQDVRDGRQLRGGAGL